MKIVDAHAHIYPEKIAAKAVQAVGEFYNYDGMAGLGTPEDLLAAANTPAATPANTPATPASTPSNAPASTPQITNFIVHSVATAPKNVRTINDFIADQCAVHPEFIGFGTMHPDCENMQQEVEHALARGLRGFKLHPDTQQVNADDPRLMDFYEIIQGRVPIVMHAGDYRYDFSSPKRLARVLKSFPKLVMDAAHFGGWSIFDRGYDELASEFAGSDRLFVDTSSASHWLGQRHMAELVRLWGADRVMFGSDYPMWNPAAELQFLQSCGLSEAELDQVLHGSAERFLS